ncbi:hypothetical protein ACSSWA_07270 [Melioribacter sp. Ez-97]|uniref:hypothetical protein n=1 Tax=Melioribacter sp. Ez-97 TaxID=3423434 RepID=UPI003ED8975F
MEFFLTIIIWFIMIGNDFGQSKVLEGIMCVISNIEADDLKNLNKQAATLRIPEMVYPQNNAIDAPIVPKFIIGTVNLANRYEIELSLDCYASDGNGISVGDEFEVIGIGKEIKIGSKVIKEKTKKGIIRVDNVFPDYATASTPTGIIITEGDKGEKVVSR